MCCGQSGHLARGCPKQNVRPTSIFEGQGIVIQQEAEELELQKKWMWSAPSLGTWLCNFPPDTTLYSRSSKFHAQKVIIHFAILFSDF